MASKTECNITRRDFQASAKATRIALDCGEYMAEAREFSTGSLGWGASEKGWMTIGGEKVKVQIGITITVIGSKDLPRNEESPANAPSAAKEAA